MINEKLCLRPIITFLGKNFEKMREGKGPSDMNSRRRQAAATQQPDRRHRHPHSPPCPHATHSCFHGRLQAAVGLPRSLVRTVLSHLGRHLLPSSLYSAARQRELANQIHHACSPSIQLLVPPTSSRPCASPKPTRITSLHHNRPRRRLPPQPSRHGHLTMVSSLRSSSRHPSFRFSFTLMP